MPLETSLGLINKHNAVGRNAGRQQKVVSLETIGVDGIQPRRMDFQHVARPRRRNRRQYTICVEFSNRATRQIGA